MKLNMFKLRKNNPSSSHVSQIITAGREILEPTPSPLQKSTQLCQQNMTKLMSMFQTFMTNSSKNTSKESGPYDNQTFNKSQLQYQTRDRHIIFNVPRFQGEEISKKDIEKWVTEVCMAAFSSAFNYYVTEQMTFEQSKIFCSQSILGNLLRFTQKHNLEEKHMEIINQHLSDNVLEYLQQKYPLTQSNDVNKALQKELEQTNNLDLLQNDFLHSNGIIFKFRQTANYNDTIMKVLNTAMQVCEQVAPVVFSNNTTLSNYQDFQIYMGDLFEKVYSEEWVHGFKHTKHMNESNIRMKEEEHQEKYKDKVKEYTHYMINRKISCNIPTFSQQQINGQNLMIQNPAILRILTKWCEELWIKFQSQSYFAQRAQPVVLQDPERINPFFKWMKSSIDKRLQGQKIKILQFKKKLDSHCNFQQAVILLKYLQDDDVNFIPKYEKAYGKFSTHMVHNLHSYIILLLNRLIHGLLTVSKQFHDKQIDKSWQDWPAPPNLVTFKIGDLIRCKCSSKEKEIIAIYKNIMHISNTNPQKLKIVRIKNRLRDGTNDILINVKFNNKIVSEIQLQVINKSKTKFIQCSNAFSHYIYELKRSIFGPISEMCSIWNNSQARAKTFQKLIKANQSNFDFTTNFEHPKCIDTQDHDFDNCVLPFECSQCKNSYFHNNYVILNKFCKNCSIYICVRCQIKELSYEELKEKILKGSKFKELQSSKLKQNKIPQYGLCIKLESRQITIQKFTYMKVQSKYWLFGMTQDNKLYQIQKVRNKKQINKFLREYCIFQFNLQDGKKRIKITEKEALQFTVRQYLKESYSQHKESLVLTQIRFSTNEMNNLIKEDGGNDIYRKRIKKIEYASNYIDNISYFSVFQNVTDINIDYNYLKTIASLQMWKNLEKIQMRDNKHLQQIGDQIGQLDKLEQIKIISCNINTISNKIGNLKNLVLLKISSNKITSLPTEISNLVNLKQLDISSNKITQLPPNMENLSSLTKLNMSVNALKELPQSITTLTNLVTLALSRNQLQTLPQSFNKLQKLTKLEIKQNRIIILPKNCFEIETLKHINLKGNKLTQFEVNLSLCNNLEALSIETNQITTITETIENCTNLMVFEFSFNHLETLPKGLSKLKKLLSIFRLNNNNFKQIPRVILEIPWITEIYLFSNKLQSIPDELKYLKHLEGLNLSTNCIKNIPDSFQVFKELKSLDLKQNQIEVIPDFITKFSILKKRNNPIDFLFKGNKIKELSPHICEFMGEELTLSKNLLEVIPVQHIKDKTVIKKIAFPNNKIKEIPAEIKEFKGLTSLDISGNLIQVLPAELAECTYILKNFLNITSNPLKSVLCMDFAQEKVSVFNKKVLTSIENKEKGEEKKIQLEEFQSSGEYC